MERTLLPEGTLLRGVYQIESQLASGGFGNTYKARNMQFEEHYAVKEFFMEGINERDDDQKTVSVSNSENVLQYNEQLEKFKKEARRLRKLQNSHIVKVHDLFEENGTAYYVMDFIDGESLSARLKRSGALSEGEVLTLLPQVLDALQTVHANGLWHLDLKPANIMINADGHALLIDFGASKQLNAEGGATASTSLCYTPGFAPPEQVDQNMEKFGPWTDLYALGATLFNLLTNQRPPASSDISEIPDEVFSPMSHCSQQMQTVVRWLLQPNRRQRPQNVEEVEARMNVLFAKKKSQTPAEETKTIPQPAKPTSPVRPQPAKPQPAPRPTPPRRPLPQKKKGLSPWLFVGAGAALIVVAGIVIGAIVLFSGSEKEDITALNDHQLDTPLDTLAYAVGMCQSEGCWDYVASNGADTTRKQAFYEGVQRGAGLTTTSSIFDDAADRDAHTQGLTIGNQIVSSLQTQMNAQLFADSTQSLSTQKFVAGFLQALNHDHTVMSAEEATEKSSRLTEKMLSERAALDYADNKRAGEEFMARKKREQGVYELPRSGGVLYRVIKNGNGPTPSEDDQVRMRYEGKTIDGHVFDKSRGTATFRLSEVIPGWRAAVTRMNVGSEWEIYIPQEQAYGRCQVGDNIAPFSALMFKITLVGVEH